MDFKKFVETAKQKTKEYSDKAIDYSSKKLAESSFTIKNQEDIAKIIEQSKNRDFTNKETGITKTFVKKSVLIIGEEKSDFYKEALYMLPVLATKGFSKNTPVKIADANIEGYNYGEIQVEEFPSLVLFENTEVKKVITGKENILKLVKNWDLDINKQIEEL